MYIDLLMYINNKPDLWRYLQSVDTTVETTGVATSRWAKYLSLSITTWYTCDIHC